MIALLRKNYPFISTLVSRGIVTLGVVLWNFSHAKLLGAADYGILSMAYAVVLGVSYLTRFGLEGSLIKFFSDLERRGQSGKVGALTLLSLGLVALLAILAQGVFYSVATGLEHLLDLEGLALVLQAVLWCLVFISLNGVLMGYFRGLHFFGLANFLDSGGILLSASIATLFISLAVEQFTLSWAVKALLLACIFNFLCGISVFSWRYRGGLGQFFPLAISRTEYVSVSANFMVMSFVSYVIIWGGVLVIGYFLEAEDVGVFSIILRLGLVISFLSIVTSNILPTLIANMYSRGDIAGLKQLLNRFAWLMILTVTPLSILIAVFAGELLGLFGEEFVSDSSIVALRLMVLCQFLSVIACNGSYLVRMTGHDATARNMTVLSAVVTITLALLLTPWFGLAGAAVGVGIGIALQNVSCAVIAYKLLGLNVLPRLGMAGQR